MIPPSDLPALASSFERFGALRQAEQLYRQALEHEPGNADLWQRLASICHARGGYEEAVTCLHRALELCPERGTFHNELGIALVALLRPAEAASAFRAAIEIDPDNALGHNNLGIALSHLGDAQTGLTSYTRALELKPNDPTVLHNQGDALASLGEFEQAIVCYRRAVEVCPLLTEAWLKLARVFRNVHQNAEAVACYEQAAKLRPNDASALGELAIFLMELGDLDSALARCEQALLLRPEWAEMYSNLGLVLMARGQSADAQLRFEQALYLRPELAEVHNNLGLALLNQQRLQEARVNFKQALSIHPDMPDALNNLGLTLIALGQPDDALECFQRAVRIEPNHTGALANLANAYKDQGRAQEAMATYRRALSARPNGAALHSNLLLAMQYDPGVDAAARFREAQCYARRHADPLAGSFSPHQRTTLVNRRLRIGYVSSDFREHPVAYFLEPILVAHNHDQFEVFCYADVPQPDTFTVRFQGCADHWQSLVGLSDHQAAEVIRRDEIDILVDLAGHTAGNRLLAFARKPAPIQASYLGYLGTTGLSTIDYYITDAHADPPVAADVYYQEKLVRLADCAFCYRPGPAPEVCPTLPALQSRHLTFGCLNHPSKISNELLALWAQVLTSVPESRLVLRTGTGRHVEERIRSVLTGFGVAPAHVLFAENTPTRFDYLNLYQSVDIGLDPFPYNGVTTTCDALWMGVPVVSFAGLLGAARQGVRFLHSAGMGELIANTPTEYVRIASQLADDLERLEELHATMRARMIKSPLMDATRLTHELEEAFQTMWARWAGIGN